MNKQKYQSELESNRQFVKNLCSETDESISDYQDMKKLNNNADHHLKSLRDLANPFVSPLLHGRRHLTPSELDFLARIMKDQNH